MPKEDFTPMLKTYESSLDRATSKHEVYSDFLERIDVDLNDAFTYEEKLKLWTKQRIELKKARNDISSLGKHLRSEREKLSEIYESTTKSSPFVEYLDNLDNKYNPTDLLNSMREITTELENTITEIDEYIGLAKELFNQKAHRDTTSRRLDHSPGNRTSRRPQIQLQAIEVPMFDGKPENYPEFIAVFDELVNQNTDFSHLQKAMYLKRALKGDAAKCIEGIPATGENYARLLNKIISRYSNALVNQHGIMRKLENLARAIDNSSSCEHTFNEIDIILNQLTSTGLHLFESCDPMWQRIILRKFPERMAERILLDSHDKKEFTIDVLMNALKKLIFGKHFLEESGFVNFAPTINETGHPTHCHRGSHSSEQAYYATSREFKNNPPNVVHLNKLSLSSQCIFCPNGNHSIENCSLPIQVKKDYLKQYRLCWKCFDGDHASFKCELQNCPCGGLHHHSICTRRHEQRHMMSNIQPVLNNNRQVKPTYPIVQQENPSYRAHAAIVENMPQDEYEEQILQVHHASIEQEKEKLTLPVLMTCRAPALLPSDNRYVETTLFLDTGSQVTLVSEKYAKLMKLKVLSREEYIISGVNQQSELVKGHIVEIILKDLQGNRKVITGLTKSRISQGFQAAKLDDADMQFLIKNNIDTLNCQVNSETVHPDILIGADYYNDLVTNVPTVELPSGLRILKTIFGATVFGATKNVKEKMSKIPTFTNHSCIVNTLCTAGCTIKHERMKKKRRVSVYQVTKRKPQGEKVNPRICESKVKNKTKERLTLSIEMIQLLRKKASLLNTRKRSRFTNKIPRANMTYAKRLAHLYINRCVIVPTSVLRSSIAQGKYLKESRNKINESERTFNINVEKNNCEEMIVETECVNKATKNRGSESGMLIQ